MSKNQESQVSISEASRTLGVSEVTLRQWTDDGKIKAFITPGGHRRYSKTELKRFMGSHKKMLGLRDLALRLEDSAPLHREIDRKFLKATHWYNSLSEESKEHLADLGRQLLKLTIRYITEPSRHEEIVELSHEIGRDLGGTLSTLGLTLTDSVEAFIAHRDPIINAATDLLKKKQAANGRVVAAIPMVAHIMDEALVVLVAAHQQHRHKPRKELTGVL